MYVATDDMYTELMHDAQPGCPLAKGAVKGVGNVQHNLHLKAQFCIVPLKTCLLS